MEEGLLKGLFYFSLSWSDFVSNKFTSYLLSYAYFALDGIW